MNLTPKISPSMMCADIIKLSETLNVFKEYGIDYLHIDIMDGVFVPNYTLGTDYIKQLRKISSIPLDIHLMIDRPENKISWFEPQPGEYVSIHYESTPHVHRALYLIKEFKAKPMIALNPGTHYKCIEHLLDDIDAVLIMTVNPGYAGQKLVEPTLKKIASLRNWLDKLGYNNIEIEADGNCSFINVKNMLNAGANIFVAGSSSVFTAELPLAKAIQKFRNMLK